MDLGKRESEGIYGEWREEREEIVVGEYYMREESIFN